MTVVSCCNFNVKSSCIELEYHDFLICKARNIIIFPYTKNPKMRTWLKVNTNATTQQKICGWLVGGTETNVPQWLCQKCEDQHHSIMFSASSTENLNFRIRCCFLNPMNCNKGFHKYLCWINWWLIANQIFVISRIEITIVVRKTTIQCSKHDIQGI